MTKVTTPKSTKKKNSASISKALHESDLETVKKSLSKKQKDGLKKYEGKLYEQTALLTMWSSPVATLTYFSMYVSYETLLFVKYVSSHRMTCTAVMMVVLAGMASYFTDGAHQSLVVKIEEKLLWYGYWILLGVASSIGLGTGLHTFVLFLGPFIASVTTAAFECKSLRFPTRGPDSFICHTPPNPGQIITIWQVASKVYLESFFWGLGTAIGELPPYFVARASALSGRKSEELDYIQQLRKKSFHERSLKDKLLISVYDLMHGYGFWGILLCASIPNPLFDLAGITCGQFLIPFSTFFGATVIGKAIIKTSLQAFFVIVIFSKDTIELLLELIHQYAPSLYPKLERLVHEQTAQFLKVGSGKEGSSDHKSIISLIWNGVIVVMLSYFLLSIINSFAQTYHSQLHEQKLIAKAMELQKAEDD